MIPSDEFLAAFGAITFHYASAEFGIKATIGGIVGAHVFDGLVMLEPTSSLQLRNVAKSIVKASLLDDRYKEKFCQIIGDFGKHGPLRNYVAHSRWTNGSRAHSIKPVGLDIRSGTAKLLGYDDNETDYILQDFQDTAKSLFNISYRIVNFQEETGISADIAQKEAETRAAIEARLGISTSASESSG